MPSTRRTALSPPPPPSPALLAALRPLAVRKVALVRQGQPKKAQRKWFDDLVKVAGKHGVSASHASHLVARMAALHAAGITPPPLPSSVAG